MNFKSLVEERLNELAPQDENICSEAVRYALLGNGKRFRPILTLLTVQALQGDIQAALSAACALEMIHAYSMIHDDLPCMDNDDWRRGKPTVHKVFPESIAVLAGDWLLTQAFEVVASSTNLTPEQRVQLTQILASRSGGKGMILGQVLDITAESPLSFDIKMVEKIHRYKTGALIVAAVEFGCVIARGTIIPEYRHFAECIGLAFQIIDDILDITDGESKHGRESDHHNEKATYATLLGLEAARDAASHYYSNALEVLPTAEVDFAPILNHYQNYRKIEK